MITLQVRPYYNDNYTNLYVIVAKIYLFDNLVDVMQFVHSGDIVSTKKDNDRRLEIIKEMVDYLCGYCFMPEHEYHSTAIDGTTILFEFV